MMIVLVYLHTFRCFEFAAFGFPRDSLPIERKHVIAVGADRDQFLNVDLPGRNRRAASRAF